LKLIARRVYTARRESVRRPAARVRAVNLSLTAANYFFAGSAILVAGSAALFGGSNAFFAGSGEFFAASGGPSRCVAYLLWQAAQAL
jgi:hypothetical protein